MGSRTTVREQMCACACEKAYRPKLRFSNEIRNAQDRARVEVTYCALIYVHIAHDSCLSSTGS